MKLCFDFLEDLLQSVTLQGNGLVVVGDFLDLLYLLLLRLRLYPRNLLLNHLFPLKVTNHLLNHALLLRALQLESAVSYQSVYLAQLLLVDDGLEGVFVHDDLFVDDFSSQQVVQSLLVLVLLHLVNCLDLGYVGFQFNVLVSIKNNVT